MKLLTFLMLAALLCPLPASAGKAHDVRGWDPKTDAFDVIDAKCQSCHTRERIEKAATSKSDMKEILKKMEKKGVKLSDNEKEVLGIFWKTPYKNK